MDLVPKDYFQSLQQLYSNDRNLEGYWTVEEPILNKIIPEIAENISFNYSLIRPKGIGGSGIVSIVLDKNLKTNRALKISRPSPGKEKLLARILTAETESLLRLSHPNLIRIFAQGSINYEKQDYPYYVMEYVDGVKDADDYFLESDINENATIKIFYEVLLATQYLHEQGTIHMDIKPGNILVTPKGIPIISDLGFAKNIRLEEGYTIIGGTEGYIHPEARKLVLEAKSDPNRLRGQAPRDVLKETWDLYSLGKTFILLLNIIAEEKPKLLSNYCRRYLKLLSCRLLDGYNRDDELAIGLTISTFQEIRYKNVKEVIIDIEKLIGSYNLESRIPELNLHLQDTIQASTLAITPFTKRVREILSHHQVMRLGNYSQLGLLNLVYPTAIHSRLEHSIGTFSIMCRFILAVYNDPLNPLFRQIMNEEDIKAALLIALLHDVGHYPLAHDLEEADENMFSHEKMAKTILSDKDSSLIKLIENEDGWNISTNRLLSVFEAKPITLEGTLKDRILHSLIDGPLDADKTDYLIRDTLNLGLCYGKGIDIERLLRCLTIIFRAQSKKTYASVGIHEKGKVPAEAIAFARYAMFGQVYWHHAYRSIKAMIIRMVWEMLTRCKKDNDRKKLRKDFNEFILPKKVDDQKQMDLFYSGKSPSISLTEKVCQIHQTDLMLLSWISDRSGPVGKELLGLLKNRNLFKRILVLTREKLPDKTIWDEISSFYSANKRNWRKKLSLQRNYQKRIVELVENPIDTPASTSIITPDARNKFIVDGRRKTILLIDVPPGGKEGGDIKLEYMIEEDRRKYKTDELRTGYLEQSLVWKVLHNNFTESIGKIRLFCHPEHSDFLSAFVERIHLENALTEAINITESE